jgi:hypothetical protein
MAIFQPPDDAAYLAWLAVNPNGYVINAERGGRQYVMLHRAMCGTIDSQPPFVGPSYIKLCSASLSELDEWALQRRGRPASRCNAAGRDCWHDLP